MRVIFNGPGAVAWRAADKMRKNGQRPISLKKLSKLAEDVPERDRLPEKRKLPI